MRRELARASRIFPLAERASRESGAPPRPSLSSFPFSLSIAVDNTFAVRVRHRAYTCAAFAASVCRKIISVLPPRPSPLSLPDLSLHCLSSCARARARLVLCLVIDLYLLVNAPSRQRYQRRTGPAVRTNYRFNLRRSRCHGSLAGPMIMHVELCAGNPPARRLDLSPLT